MKNRSERFRMIAKTISGLEVVLAEELINMGADGIKVLNRGVQFYGDKMMLYKANYHLRTALRVIIPIKVFEAVNEMQLYEEVKKIDWSTYLDVSGTFSVDGVTSYSNITHSKYLALKTKDAIADQFREKYGKRPNVSLDNADLVVNVRIFRNEATISIDSSGDSLHKRGYRVETGPAPISEVLAAGLILLSGWDRKSNIIDPMCGSGTIPIEAALIACNIPPGSFRKEFCFMHWKDFDTELWDRMLESASQRVTGFTGKIIGSDRSGRIIPVARNNAESAGVGHIVTLKTNFIDDVLPPIGGGVVIMNPPYNERLKTEDVISLYQTIGDSLKRNFAGYQAWVISAHKEALKFVGLKPFRNYTVFNGQLECRFSGFELYEGSKKDQFENQQPDPATMQKEQSKRTFRRKRTGT